MILSLTEEHPGEEPTQEFPIHRREEQKRQSRPVIAAPAVHMNVYQSWLLELCRDFEQDDLVFSVGPGKKIINVWTKWAIEAIWTSDEMDNEWRLMIPLKLKSKSKSRLRLLEEYTIHILISNESALENVH